MKNSFLLLLALSVLPFMVSCDNDNEPEVTVPNPPNHEDEVPGAISVEEDVLSFDMADRAIVFATDTLVCDTAESGALLVSFSLRDSVIMADIPYITALSSKVYNELVLVSFGDSHYLYDGYPSLSSLGGGAEVNEALRRENFERHRAGWELFVAYLREEGRLSE